jgi:hypothetical protein
MKQFDLSYRHLTLTQQISLFLILSIILYLISPFFAYPKADAATFGAVYVRLDRMAASTATTGLVCATTPSGNSLTEGKVVVTFPTGFTVNETEAEWVVATTNIPNGATAWPGIDTASLADNTTKAVTFPSTNLAASTLYCFRWTDSDALTTSTAGNNKTGTIATTESDDDPIDSDTYAVSVQDDQIGVSAAVSQTFTFSTGSDITFTTSPLTVTTVNYGSSTANVSTNGANGYIAWVRSANGNLTSSATSATITTPGSIDNAVSDLTGGTYGYVLDVILTTDGSGTGTLTQAANFGQEYDGGNTCSSATDGGTLTTSLEPIAASNGTTDGDVLTLCTLVRINGAQTAASDYADTLTVVAAGRF